MPFTFEEIELSNPEAIKINALLLTTDDRLELMPVSTAYVETLIDCLNNYFLALYATENWQGFALMGRYNTKPCTID